MDILIALFTDYGYAAVFFILLICGFGVPIPEDITLVAGGIISGLGFADVHKMFLVCMAGVLIGDATMFMLGRIFGARILCFPPYAAYCRRTASPMCRRSLKNMVTGCYLSPASCQVYAPPSLSPQA